MTDNTTTARHIKDVVNSVLSDYLEDKQSPADKRHGRLAVPLWIVDTRPDLLKKILANIKPLPGHSSLIPYRAQSAGKMYYWGESEDFAIVPFDEEDLPIYKYELVYNEVKGIDFFGVHLHLD